MATTCNSIGGNPAYQRDRDTPTDDDTEPEDEEDAFARLAQPSNLAPEDCSAGVKEDPIGVGLHPTRLAPQLPRSQTLALTNASHLTTFSLPPSGVEGVHRNCRGSWIALYRTPSGDRRTKTFNPKIFGEEAARNEAVAFRRGWEEEQRLLAIRESLQSSQLYDVAVTSSPASVAAELSSFPEQPPTNQHIASSHGPRSPSVVASLKQEPSYLNQTTLTQDLILNSHSSSPQAPQLQPLSAPTLAAHTDSHYCSSPAPTCTAQHVGVPHPPQVPSPLALTLMQDPSDYRQVPVEREVSPQVKTLQREREEWGALTSLQCDAIISIAAKESIDTGMRIDRDSPETTQVMRDISAASLNPLGSTLVHAHGEELRRLLIALISPVDVTDSSDPADSLFDDNAEHSPPTSPEIALQYPYPLTPRRTRGRGRAATSSKFSAVTPFLPHFCPSISTGTPHAPDSPSPHPHMPPIVSPDLFHSSIQPRPSDPPSSFLKSDPPSIQEFAILPLFPRSQSHQSPLSQSTSARMNSELTTTRKEGPRRSYPRPLPQSDISISSMDISGVSVLPLESTSPSSPSSSSSSPSSPQSHPVTHPTTSLITAMDIETLLIRNSKQANIKQSHWLQHHSHQSQSHQPHLRKPQNHSRRSFLRLSDEPRSSKQDDYTYHMIDSSLSYQPYSTDVNLAPDSFHPTLLDLSKASLAALLQSPLPCAASLVEEGVHSPQFLPFATGPSSQPSRASARSPHSVRGRPGSGGVKVRRLNNVVNSHAHRHTRSDRYHDEFEARKVKKEVKKETHRLSCCESERQRPSRRRKTADWG
eukprot:GHVN01053255.1.p1 GENE.GHVN01053255.1~~GHVN01053255.1.p1  ORF type:complete len:824 (-),score=163.02 GHVN01053255.1:136-2574(-)